MKAKKRETLNLVLNPEGVDQASAWIQEKMSDAGVDHADVVRIRLTMEDLLEHIVQKAEEPVNAKLNFRRRMSRCELSVRYDGAPLDPTETVDQEGEDYIRIVLSQTGIRPIWRWDSEGNRLNLNVPLRSLHAGLVMVGWMAAAIAVGLLGRFLPGAVRATIVTYGLNLVSQAFMNVLRTYIGVMIFLSVLPGGSAAGGQAQAVVDMILGILPSNPVQPFLEGNTLQIIFMAILAGVIIQQLGSQAYDLRRLILQLAQVVTRCVNAVCFFLPLFIFSSLVSQMWGETASMFLQFWKPLLFAAVVSAVLVIVMTLYTGMRLKVSPSLLLHKLMPDAMIGLATSSSAAAFSVFLEANEKKLGMEPSFSKAASSVGIILCPLTAGMVFMLVVPFLAQLYGVRADLIWWITLWFTGSLFAISTPPVAGGTISCLSILMLQLNVPAEALAAAAALATVLDFILTGARLPLFHMELLLQADRFGFIDKDVLRSR